MNTDIKVLEDDGKLIKYLELSFPTAKINVTNGNVSIYEKTNIKKINPLLIQFIILKLNLLFFILNVMK